MPKYDHIHIRNLGVTSDGFAATDTGRTKRPPERSDRSSHGARLQAELAQLRAIFAESSRRQENVGVPESQRGSVVTIEGAAGKPLDVGPRQLERSKLSILGVRRTKNYAGDRFEARVFFTEKGFETLIDRAEKYTRWKPGSGRRPDNFWLFDAAESFRAAEIMDFWNDEYARLPDAIARAEWEVWTRRALDNELQTAIERLNLESQGEPSTFQELKVYNLLATRQQIENLIRDSAAVVELRGASSFVARDHELPPAERQSRVRDLRERLIPAGAGAPRITLLDTGVSRDHPLLQASLPAECCYSADPRWDPFDSDGHGTKMAGVALFGNLAGALSHNNPVRLPVQLESVVISSPSSPVRLPARDALARAVEIVEQTPARRVYCLAATAIGERETGLPTSTSATLDQLAFGDGQSTRLICAAVGNVDTGPARPYRIAEYHENNVNHPVQSPAQAMNALAVGAATHMCSVPNLVAPLGGLSPTSRTALGWDADRPHKPDIVMEGGNQLIDIGGRTSIPHPPDMIMTTNRDFASRPLTVTGETSAATAAASRLAALVMQKYPSMRAETVRGLIVNSARWTDAMEEPYRAQLKDPRTSSTAAHKILSCYGWGIPDEDRLFSSANNALTLIIEDSLRPYGMGAGNRVRLREMKYFKLPWPDEALEALGGTDVEVRCTLSYFVEPDPGSASRDEHGKYSGHKLKFDFKRHGETDEQAQRRFNAAIDADVGEGDESGWLLGRNKTRGTIHHDVWNGPAYLLRKRDGISVAPNHGWWSTNGTNPTEKFVNFSLIVTVSTRKVNIDFYSEVLTQIPPEKIIGRTPVQA